MISWAKYKTSGLITEHMVTVSSNQLQKTFFTDNFAQSLE
jgi:hypothetical protein